MKTTHWQVITGGPCSGKTTVINELIKRGYECKPEVARKYISLLIELASRRQIKRSPLSVQYAILEAKLARERQLDPEQLVFFDRGMPDSIAYFEFSGMTDAQVDAIEACKQTRYEQIFYLEPLPFKNDGERKETPEQAKQLADLILNAYRQVGYEPIIIPVCPIEERVQMILRAIEI